MIGIYCQFWLFNHYFNNHRWFWLRIYTFSRRRIKYIILTL
jgi:hypothetical protein